jgi:hypothetical protein
MQLPYHGIRDVGRRRFLPTDFEPWEGSASTVGPQLTALMIAVGLLAVWVGLCSRHRRAGYIL